MHSPPVAPTQSRLLVKRGGHSITRHIPRSVVIIDTREKAPFLFTNHQNWIAGTVRRKLSAGDYSVEGMEDLLRLERKSLSDLITTLMQCRDTFLKECRRLAAYRWRAVLVETSYERVKSTAVRASQTGKPPYRQSQGVIRPFVQEIVGGLR